jgi:hypothetical protein
MRLTKLWTTNDVLKRKLLMVLKQREWTSPKNLANEFKTYDPGEVFSAINELYHEGLIVMAHFGGVTHYAPIFDHKPEVAVEVPEPTESMQDKMDYVRGLEAYLGHVDKVIAKREKRVGGMNSKCND